MTKSLEVFSRRPEQTKERANEREDNSVGIIQSQEQKGKNKKTKKPLTVSDTVKDTTKYTNMHLTGVTERDEREGQRNRKNS